MKRLIIDVVIVIVVIVNETKCRDHVSGGEKVNTNTNAYANKSLKRFFVRLSRPEDGFT